MAENLSVKKSPIECVQECPLCLHQLKLPQTLQQCLHSYCKSCLDKVPQKTQDGQQGWLCPMCENFSKCDQIQQNTFIEELQKIPSEPELGGDIKCEQCLDDCRDATWKCAECKMGLCENGKAVHLKIPMLKCHKILPLEKDGERLIDNIVYCKVHDGIPAQLNCRDCAQLICYTCKITDHEEHKAETVEQALERILPETESSAKQLDENIGIIKAQIKGVNNEIGKTKESYASIRMQMDDHLEKVICRMRAMKAQMEDDVNEQESIALDTLKELQKQLEKQLGQASVIGNLTAVVTTKTRHTSQLQQFQTGLLDKVKAGGGSKNEGLHLQLLETKFIEGHRIKDELKNVFGSLRFDLKEHYVTTSGEVWADNNDNFMCHDFEEIVDYNFVKHFEIDIEGKWCNMLSHVDNMLLLPIAYDSLIQLYDKDGKLQNTIDTGDKKITVMREACNGEFICGTPNGLYSTNKDFKEWKKLAQGTFSDVVIHQRNFFVLESGSEYIEKYNLTQDEQWQSFNKYKLVDVPKDLKLDLNTTLAISGNYYWVTSSVNKELYKFSDTGKYLGMWEIENVDPVICGVDKKGKVLLADSTSGKFFLLQTEQKEKITIKEIWQSFKVEHVRDAVLDDNNNLWTLSGDSDQKLTKLTQNKIN